jgi:hypothetical protein
MASGLPYGRNQQTQSRPGAAAMWRSVAFAGPQRCFKPYPTIADGNSGNLWGLANVGRGNAGGSSSRALTMAAHTNILVVDADVYWRPLMCGSGSALQTTGRFRGGTLPQRRSGDVGRWTHFRSADRLNISVERLQHRLYVPRDDRRRADQSDVRTHRPCPR